MKRKETEHFHDLLIVGAGASGLMAAISAARQGVKVALLEHTQEMGAVISPIRYSAQNIIEAIMGR